MEYNVGRVIGTPLDGPEGFARVPNWIFSLQLSEQARLLLAWAAGRPPRWEPTVGNIRSELGFGKDKWRRLVGELGPLEVIIQSKSRSGGRTTHSLIIDLRPLCPTTAQKPPIARDPTVMPRELRRSRLNRPGFSGGSNL